MRGTRASDRRLSFDHLPDGVVAMIVRTDMCFLDIRAVSEEAGLPARAGLLRRSTRPSAKASRKVPLDPEPGCSRSFDLQLRGRRRGHAGQSSSTLLTSRRTVSK